MDHIRQGTFKIKDINCLVLDEADEMLNMGFLEDIEWIIDQLPENKQMVLFSATMPSEIRYIAKNIVSSKIADKCLIQLAYAIGVSKPLSIYVDLFDNDEEKNKHIESLIKKNFDLSPRGIREMLGLNKPIYEKSAAYGHFGRDPGSDGSFSWEKTDKITLFSK